MITIFRTDSNNTEFLRLVEELNNELAIRDGSDHAWYSQHNSTSSITHVVVLYMDEAAVSCGGLKPFEPGSMEVKRMYTVPSARGKRLAAQVLRELEQWAIELGCNKLVLETGKRQPEAIALYQRTGYSFIPNYAQYEKIDNSVCFEKQLSVS